MTTAEQLDNVVEGPHFELIIGGAGQVATAETVEVEAPQDSYTYEVEYGADGQIAGAKSWKYEAETDESTFTRFDATGKVVNRFVNSLAMGLSLQYEGENLVYSSQVSNDGKNVDRVWYGANRQPKSTIQIDMVANTHTMTIHQPGIGDWVKTTPYAGAEGWTQ